MDTKPIALDPKIFGFWVKRIRDTSHWSQEALAANAGLDVRTVQRFEAGKPASLTTRRALARGLGYDNHDISDSPDFIASVYKIIGALTGTKSSSLIICGYLPHGFPGARPSAAAHRWRHEFGGPSRCYILMDERFLAGISK